MRKIVFLLLLFLAEGAFGANPLDGMLERIDRGASKKFTVRIVPADEDYFRIENVGRKIAVTGNNRLSAATGVNWYLKHVAGIHICWNQPRAALPKVLPRVAEPIVRRCGAEHRYYLNYCTYGYSMAFWDWERWEQEIDWMALHGVNMALAATGTANVWRNMLPRLGFDTEQVEAFLAGPAYQPWMLMNNLEGWGGPNSARWYDEQEKLQKRILARMREFGIEPILPGYSGMLPSAALAAEGWNAQDAGKWISFQRPAFLLPSDERFAEVAEVYYDELTRLYGKAEYYSIDPFHEMNPTEDNRQEVDAGFDFAAAGEVISEAMKRCNPSSKWIVQGWMENPRAELISRLAPQDLLILDLNSDCCPQWGTDKTQWPREGGYGEFPWLYCMLHNFGGVTGMFGKIATLIDGYYDAQADNRAGKTLAGIGATMEAIENNPVMYELLFELPWRGPQRFTKGEWLDDYVFARYGVRDPQLREVWEILGNTVYASRYNDQRVVSAESVFTDRPGGSCEGPWSPAYDPQQVVEAAALMVGLADKYGDNDNFEYDLVDLVRQTLADKGRDIYKDALAAAGQRDPEEVKRLGGQFLKLLLDQDRLLASRREFTAGNWIDRAKSCGADAAEKALMERNARTLVTVWGNEASSETLHDYSHREWSGLLRDLYYPRWAAYYDMLEKEAQGIDTPEPDYYGMEHAWANGTNHYSPNPDGNASERAKTLFNDNFKPTIR